MWGDPGICGRSSEARLRQWRRGLKQISGAGICSFCDRRCTFQTLEIMGAPPRSATLPWWWGSAPMTRKISNKWRRGATKCWPNSGRQIATRYQCSCAGFGLTADHGFIAVYLRLHSRLRLYSHYLYPCIYIRGCALGWADTASALGRCKSLSTPEVR